MTVRVTTGLLALSAALVQAPASGQPADPAPVKSASRAENDTGIPQVPAQSTAAVVVPVPPAADPRAPLPIFRPAYPYPTTPPSTAESGVRPVETLADAIALAYKTNPELAAQRSSLRATDFRVPGARALYGPTIDASGNYAFTRDRTETLPGTGVSQQGWTSAASLILRQPVFTFGRNRAAESTALSQVALGRDTLRIVESQVLLDVVNAYVSVIRDATAVTIARQNLALLERQFTDSNERFRVREITSTDLQQVETRLEFARGQLLSAQGQLGASQARFLRDVGAPPGELRQPDVLSVPVLSLTDAYAIADSESPVIRAAQSREKVSRSAVQAAKAEFLPRVDIRSSADYGSVNPYNDTLRTTRLRGEAIVTVPLTNGGLRQAQLGEAREANQADWRLIEQAERETRSAVAEAWNQLAAARSSLAFFLNAVESARQAYEGARTQERAGARTTLDVLDLARDLLTVQTNYNTALSNEYLARANLLSAMGRLEAPKLISVPAYDPTAHFRRVANDSDLPLLTPVLSALDGAVVSPVKGDRPNLDPAATTATSATVALPPETATVRADPTAPASAPSQ